MHFGCASVTFVCKRLYCEGNLATHTQDAAHRVQVICAAARDLRPRSWDDLTVRNLLAPPGGTNAYMLATHPTWRLVLDCGADEQSGARTVLLPCFMSLELAVHSATRINAWVARRRLQLSQ